MHPQIKAVAIDYYRTLTDNERGQPDGAFVCQILSDEFSVTPPANFATAFDTSLPRYYAEPVEDAIPRLLTAVAAQCGITLPDMAKLNTALWERCGDHPINPNSAGAVKDLHQHGLTCVLASNMVRPEAYRMRTLREAGLEFMIPACSSTIGVGKPFLRFYEYVVERCGVDDPAEILFVGDDLTNDVCGPIAAGMRAAWVDRSRDPQTPAEVMADGTLRLSHLSHLTPHLLHDGRTVRP